MGLPKVDINLLNGQLGGAMSTNDGIAGLIISIDESNIPSPDVALNSPFKIYSLDDAKQLGITEYYDKKYKTNAYFHINEFYAMAGIGAELWVLLVGKATTMEEICDINKDIAKKLIEAAEGKIKLLGITRTPTDGYSSDCVNGFDDDAFAAMLNAQVFAKQFAGVSEGGSGSTLGEYRPFRVLIEGRDFQGDTVENPLADLRTNTCNRVAIVLGSSTNEKTIVTGSGENETEEIDANPYKGASVGLALGKLVSIPVQRNIGRVKDGDLGISGAFLSNGKAMKTISIGLQNTIHDKGYIFMRRYQGKSGYFFNDDPVAVTLTDDYNSIARGRVIDKVISITYSTFINEMLDEVKVDSNGKINSALIKSYQSNIETQVNSLMTASGEISDFQAVVDPNQNVLSTNKIKVSLSIVPVGYAKVIEIDLGFVNPALK